MDSAGNLYIADSGDGRIQRRDAQGNWSVIDTPDVPVAGPGRTSSGVTALAVDLAGSLYAMGYVYFTRTSRFD